MAIEPRTLPSLIDIKRTIGKHWANFVLLLQSTPAIAPKYRKITTAVSVTIDVTDNVVSIDNGENNVQINILIDGIPAGKTIIVKRYDASSIGSILIATADGENVIQNLSTGDFVASVVLSDWGTPGACMSFVKNDDGRYEIRSIV